MIFLRSSFHLEVSVQIAAFLGFLTRTYYTLRDKRTYSLQAGLSLSRHHTFSTTELDRLIVDIARAENLAA